MFGDCWLVDYALVMGYFCCFWLSDGNFGVFYVFDIRSKFAYIT